ncbi:MAG: hypothetical protein RBT68_03995 [Spirochaetia bacterium]|jgi:hypothetical protein|nr:hypothetical protein [Spirochaetia bacterium]
MKPLVLVAICLGLATAVPAQLRVTGTEFDPPDFVPGDRVSLVARFDASGLSWDDVRKTEDFPEPGEAGPTVLSAVIERRSGTPVLVVQFIPWMAGRGQLPALVVGGLSFPAIPFEAMSSLGTDLAPPVPRPQLEPPGLRVRVYVASGLLLAFLVGILMFVSVVLPWLRRLMARWTFARIRREFDARLALLEGHSGEASDAWALLCSSLRWFLEARTGLPWRSMTPAEAEAVRAASIGPDLVAEASRLLLQGDEVRFAGRLGADLPAGLSGARAIADRVDQALVPARQPAAGGRK